MRGLPGAWSSFPIGLSSGLAEESELVTKRFASANQRQILGNNIHRQSAGPLVLFVALDRVHDFSLG